MLRSHRPRALTLASLAAGLLALAGCGGGKVSASKVESTLRLEIPPFTTVVGGKPNHRITSVSCPSGVKRKKGKTFACDVALSDGLRGKATVTQLDSNGQDIYWSVRLRGRARTVTSAH